MPDGYCDQHHLLAEIAVKMGEIHVCLLGDPKSEKASGLRAVVDRHDSVIASIQRIVWTIIGAGIVALVALVVKSWG